MSESKPSKRKSSEASSSKVHPPDQAFSRSQVFSLIDDLTAFQAEEKQQFTLLETIAEAYDVLKVVIEKHSYQSATERLAKNGINISVGTLKQYMSRLNREHEPVNIQQQNETLALTETVPLMTKEEPTTAIDPLLAFINHIEGERNPNEPNALTLDNLIEQEQSHSPRNTTPPSLRRTSPPIRLQTENTDSPTTPTAAPALTTPAALHQLVAT